MQTGLGRCCVKHSSRRGNAILRGSFSLPSLAGEEDRTDSAGILRGFCGGKRAEKANTSKGRNAYFQEVDHSQDDTSPKSARVKTTPKAPNHFMANRGDGCYDWLGELALLASGFLGIYHPHPVNST
ncbi:hypothetical protein K2X85_04130 [bacterium]|nr:hypothetical protein [bacterium]